MIDRMIQGGSVQVLDEIIQNYFMELLQNYYKILNH